MDEKLPRVLAVLAGDIRREPGNQIKYGHFLAALSQRLPLVGTYNAALQGRDRLLNALSVFHPQQRLWRERFYKNVSAFQQRSQRLAAYLQAHASEIDLVLQIGVLFDANWHPLPGLPTIIYTDYTAQLSARKEYVGRSPFSSAQRQAWLALEGQALRQARHICTRSEFVRQATSQDYGIGLDQLTAVGGGVNFTQLPALQPHPAHRPPTALFIGQDFYRKGGDLLLQAFAQVRLQLPEARLILLTDDTIPPHLSLDNVTAVSPTWDRDYVKMLFQQADLFVLPARLETWGDVLLEAMAYGLPCIGTATDAMAEIIVPEETGLLVPPENLAVLTAALARLLGNKGLRLAYGQAARRRVETQFTWSHVVERLLPIVQTAVSPSIATISHLLVR